MSLSKPKYCGGYMNNQVKTLREVLEKLRFSNRGGNDITMTIDQAEKEIKALQPSVEEIAKEIAKCLGELNLGLYSDNEMSKMSEAIHKLYEEKMK